MPSTICSGSPSNLLVAVPAALPVTIVNYDFNSGSSFAALAPILASGVTSSATGTTFGTNTGTATNANAFTQNATPGNALSMASNGANAWTFTLGGANLSKYDLTFKIYFQARDAFTNLPPSVSVAYNLNGTGFVNAGTLNLTTTYASGIFTLPADVDNPNNFFSN